MVKRRAGAEATDLLTGQLEGLNPLSWLNFPDRVGMQQGDGPSRGSEDGGTLRHTDGPHCSCGYYDVGTAKSSQCKVNLKLIPAD